MPLLRGTDGSAKMSKSFDNYIGISEPPEEMYGKTMSIPDAALEEWYRLASGLTGSDLERAIARTAAEPYAAKRALAALITATYHGAEAAERAAAHFDRLFREHAAPEDLADTLLSISDARLRHEPNGGVWVPGLLVAIGLAASNSEAMRLLEQGAITIDEQRAAGRNARVRVDPRQPITLRRGRRHYVRVRFTED
jgi:tyrosyl-tRNA synthetase